MPTNVKVYTWDPRMDEMPLNELYSTMFKLPAPGSHYWHDRMRSRPRGSARAVPRRRLQLGRRAGARSRGGTRAVAGLAGRSTPRAGRVANELLDGRQDRLAEVAEARPLPGLGEQPLADVEAAT